MGQRKITMEIRKHLEINEMKTKVPKCIRCIKSNSQKEIAVNSYLKKDLKSID